MKITNDVRCGCRPAPAHRQQLPSPPAYGCLHPSGCGNAPSVSGNYLHGVAPPATFGRDAFRFQPYINGLCAYIRQLGSLTASVWQSVFTGSFAAPDQLPSSATVSKCVSSPATFSGVGTIQVSDTRLLEIANVLRT